MTLKAKATWPALWPCKVNFSEFPNFNFFTKFQCFLKPGPASKIERCHFVYQLFNYTYIPIYRSLLKKCGQKVYLSERNRRHFCPFTPVRSLSLAFFPLLSLQLSSLSVGWRARAKEREGGKNAKESDRTGESVQKWRWLRSLRYTFWPHFFNKLLYMGMYV